MKKITFQFVQIRDQKVPFTFSWIHKILTSVCFTMFRLEQPEIKISKSFEIKHNMCMSVGTKTDTQN